jgi:cytochrome c556
MHLTPGRIAELRSEFAKGGLEASLLAAQLFEMVEKLQEKLSAAEKFAANARRDQAAQEALALEKHLADLAASGAGCPACHDSAARAVVARLKSTPAR